MENTDASYAVPAARCQTEIVIVNSRFITTIDMIASMSDVKGLLADVRTEMPGASHHVYAFRIGYGNSVVEGMSDAGEPSGTAGPPTLAVLRGTQIGDIAIVTTRFFGGTKLGTGGLVRAYTESAQIGLAQLKTRLKIATVTLGIEISYSLYERAKRLISAHSGDIVDEDFAGEIILTVILPTTEQMALSHALAELSAGKIVPVVLD
ncbi:MAG: YigZ family protein [Anaerolineaceae bacterium]|nr:YigZ family protein [Anaerolineaceae bacterium]